jgi:hypothetical protein
MSTYVPKTYRDQGGDRSVIASGGTLLAESGAIVNMASGAIQLGVVQNLRTRTLAAAVIHTAQTTLLAGITGYKYRIIDITMISTVANASTATAVVVNGTQGTSVVALVSNTVGALTDSAKVLMGTTANSSILADGASYVACDSGAGITIASTVAGLGGSTAIDTNITYVIEAA